MIDRLITKYTKSQTTINKIKMKNPGVCQLNMDKN